MVGDRRVLICEDDPAMIRIFQFLLRQHGVSNISTTSRGETVLALVLKDKPDLVLLDMMLPGKDGIAVLKELKENAIARDIPVIIVSGKEAQEQVHQAMSAGAIDYVIKPFEPMELGARIRAFLETLQISPNEPAPGSQA